MKTLDKSKEQLDECRYENGSVWCLEHHINHAFQKSTEQWEIEFEKQPGYDVNALLRSEVKKFISQTIAQAILQERNRIVEKINNWFEDNFHNGKTLSDDAYVTEKQLYDFIKALENNERKI